MRLRCEETEAAALVGKEGLNPSPDHHYYYYYYYYYYYRAIVHIKCIQQDKLVHMQTVL